MRSSDNGSTYRQYAASGTTHHDTATSSATVAAAVSAGGAFSLRHGPSQLQVTKQPIQQHEQHPWRYDRRPAQSRLYRHARGHSGSDLPALNPGQPSLIVDHHSVHGAHGQNRDGPARTTIWCFRQCSELQLGIASIPLVALPVSWGCAQLRGCDT